MNFLSQALEYRARGWCILPIGRAGNSKKPALKEWKPYQTRLPSEVELREWFSNSKLSGLAVVLGPVSGGLYSRDFDFAGSYRQWADQHPDLAKSLPTAQSKRGPHVYFCSPDRIQTKDYGDGELRGNGAYCVLPPSVHQSGHVYRWTIPLPPGPLPIVDPGEAGFCRNWRCTERAESTEPTEQPESREIASVLSVHGLVSLALPTDTHQNHHRLFLLARGVRALEKQQGRELSAAERRNIFGEWHKRAAPFLRDGQCRDDYWFEFLTGLARVKYPLGEEPITRAWDRVQKLPPPKVAQQFEQPQIRLLVALCRELQRAAGRQAFYLASRTVARLFHHETYSTAALWLRGLVAVGVLKVVKQGGPDTNRATRYRYLGPLDGPEGCTPV